MNRHDLIALRQIASGLRDGCDRGSPTLCEFYTERLEDFLRESDATVEVVGARAQEDEPGRNADG